MKFIKVLILVFINLSTYAQCDFKVIGHRGGSSYYYPENTLSALEQGFLEDIYAAEIDIRYTSDSVLVLMHDNYIDRTTNGTGNINELPYSYISTLDAGSWKSNRFIGEHVPKLVDALLLAKSYNKKLHLNMKVFVPNLVKSALEEANVPQNTIIVDPSEMSEVIQYHAVLPGTPQLFFGYPPTNTLDSTFYISLRDNGVFAAEIPAGFLSDTSQPWVADYQLMLNKYGMELWVYTVNSSQTMSEVKTYNINGMETDRPSQAKQIFCLNGEQYFYPEKRITGQWDFNRNLMGTIGSQITYIRDNTPSKLTFASTDSFGIAPIENNSVNVVKIDGLNSTEALRFYSNFFSENSPSDLSCNNAYTVVYDLLKPHSDKNFISIFQTSNNNSDDGDLFIINSNNSVGISGQYHGTFQDSTWNRLVFVFDLFQSKLDKYLNGQFIGTTNLNNSLNGRFCINNNWGVQSSNFFSDDDEETSTLFVSSVQIRNYAMTSSEILELGGVKANKISDSINVSLSEYPHIVSQSMDTTVIENSTFQLHVNALENVNYRWEINTDGNWRNISEQNIKDVATSTITIFNASFALNNAKFRCKLSNNCEIYSQEVTLNVSITSNVSQLSKNEIQVFPNPSNGEIWIDFKNLAEPFLISIVDLQGRIVFSKQINSREKSNKIDFTCKSGVYNLRIQSNNVQINNRLVVLN